MIRGFLLTWFGLFMFCVGVSWMFHLGPFGEPPPVTRCAAALAVMSVAAECTAFNATNNSCVFSMADLERLRNAGADKQLYCPVDHSDGSGNQ